MFMTDFPDEETHKLEIAHRLREWRLARGLTQEELAAIVGTSHNMIGYLETAQRNLSTKWLLRLAPALKVQPGWLLDHDPADIDQDVTAIFSQTPEENKAMAREVLRTFRHFPAVNDK